ncbi:MAG TPA: GGDEF domain-containing protein [Ilumatobacter sp.]
MSKSRLTLPAATLVVASAFAVLVSASAARADTEAGPEAGVEQIVSSLASEAAELVASEHQLVGDLAAAAGSQARAQLDSVDALGAATLAALDRFGVELTVAARTALDRLPAPSEAGSLPTSPPSDVYLAAAGDLRRIAEHPSAAIAGSTSGAVGARTPSSGLVLVAVLALVALGGSAILARAGGTRRDDELQAMAWSDSLTGLANRRCLDRDVAARRLAGGDAAVIMVDVDQFKSVNDRFGHVVGDEVLRAVGAVVVDQIRHDGVAYRYGGDELCVLLPAASSADAGEVAGRIVAAAREIGLPDDGQLTVSAGVAVSTASDLQQAIESADRAMYLAKGLGRDRAITNQQDEFIVV